MNTKGGADQHQIVNARLVFAVEHVAECGWRAAGLLGEQLECPATLLVLVLQRLHGVLEHDFSLLLLFFLDTPYYILYK